MMDNKQEYFTKDEIFEKEGILWHKCKKGNNDEEIILDIDFEPFGIHRAAKLITKKED